MFRRLVTSLVVPSARTFVSFARPGSRPLARSLPAASQPMKLAPTSIPSMHPGSGPQSLLDIFHQQRRFKSRGNTYQPSMLKRKRRAGFLARLRTRGGRKILSRRRAKGRWFLTY